MQAHRIHVVIPENHRVMIEFPATIPSGPVELIVLVPPQEDSEQQAEAPPQGRERLVALAAELAQDPRSFRELAPEERRARLRRLRGAGRGLTSGSRDNEATKRLNEIFTGDDLVQEQSRGASELDVVGTDWSTERW